MDKTIQVYKSLIFQNDVNALSFKDNNFTFKIARSTVIRISENLNNDHFIPIEKKDFGKPLFMLKIRGDLRIIFALEESKVTFLRAIRLHELPETLETLSDEVVFPYDFKEFWT